LLGLSLWLYTGLFWYTFTLELLKTDGLRALFLFLNKLMGIENLLEKTLSGMSYELVDFEVVGRSGLVRVLIDSEQGIGLEDCTTVSNHLSRLFEIEQFSYDRLEVSSPGLDRPLKKLKDFERFVGEKITVQFKLAYEGQRKFRGTLVGVREELIDVEIDDDRVITFELHEMKRANLIPAI
jgi:ribosome maturation factor RimP